MTRPEIGWLRRAHPSLWIGLIGLTAIVGIGLVAPYLLDHSATAMSGAVRLPSGPGHLLGTDALGRDVLARTLVATRLTLEMTALATVLAGLLGIGFGTAVWVSPPRIREFGLRFIDVAVTAPTLIMALVVSAILGAGVTASVIAIVLGGAPQFARLTANMTASVAQRDFVVTARLFGVPPHRVILRHLLPNIAGPLLVLFSAAFAQILIALSGLSFLGLGVQSPRFDWGGLLNAGLRTLYTQPAEALGPAIAITVTGIFASLIGDGLAATLDPRGRAVRRRGRRRESADVTVPAPARPSYGLLNVDGLSVELPDGTRLVDDVSFGIAPGEILGLVGESGSGKSLTAMSVARLLPEGLTARAARVDLDGFDLTTDRPDPRRLATEIGIVYQDPSSSFNPALRIGGQLTEVPRVHQRRRPAEAAAAAVEALRRVRIRDPEAVMRQYPHELSGGMRQRAMIAAALLSEPKLIIADEPTTALDVTVQAEVLELLREINQRGAGMLFISHDIAVVSALCHRVAVMRGGRIVEELSAEDLRAGRAQHPYTKQLLAAGLTLDEVEEPSEKEVVR